MEICDLKFTFFHVVLTFYKYITVMCVLAVLFIKADLNPNEVSSVAPHLSQTPVLSWLCFVWREATCEALNQQEEELCSWQTCLNQLLLGRKATAWIPNVNGFFDRRQHQLSWQFGTPGLMTMFHVLIMMQTLGVKCYLHLVNLHHLKT